MDYKNMDLGFVILCPNKDDLALRNTVRSIRHYAHRDIIGVVGDNAGPHDIKKMKEWCDNVYKGKDTITSLMNTGMKRIKNDWALILFEGSIIRPMLERKICRFVTSEKDVIFPIVAGKYDFVEGSCNGILVHRNTFKEVGDFPEIGMSKEGLNELEVSKMFWAEDAIRKGCQFKGVIGVRIL
jgi:hypothetical protein